MRLKISCILTDLYNKNQANNIFYRALYQILFSSLREENIMVEASCFKLQDWVDIRPFPGWWRIRANSSLKSCLLDQAKYSEDKRFSFVITQSMILTPTLQLAPHLIIVEHMLHLPMGNNKSPRYPMNNNEEV